MGIHSLVIMMMIMTVVFRGLSYFQLPISVIFLKCTHRVLSVYTEHIIFNEFINNNYFD